MAASGQFIGLDVGKARTGIARASAVAQLSEPLTTLATDDIPAKLNELDRQDTIVGVVVGLPRNLDGEATPQTEWVRQWAEQLKNQVNTPIYFQDEALTSKLAEAKQLSGKKKVDTDSLAAAIILQDFLDGPETGRVLL